MGKRPYNETEVQVAEWLFNRVMEERRAWYSDNDIEIVPWEELDNQAVIDSWLEQGRIVTDLVLGVAIAGSEDGGPPQ